MEKDINLNRTAELLRRIAFALLLACLVGRAFIAEMPFRANPINIAALSAQSQAGTSARAAVDRTESARVTFAMLLLAVTALWLLAGAIESKLEIKFPFLGVVVLLFVFLSMLSVLGAPDKRSAWGSWLEQTALLSAGFTAIQLCRSRRRFVILVIVLAGLAATLAIKAVYQRADEIPGQIAFFEANREKQLAEMGIEPGQPKERMMESRIRNTTVTGYFGLANLFASELILLLSAGIGLAGAKIICARKRRAAGGGAKRGEISSPALAAILAVAGACLVGGALALTRSRGGIGAAIVAALVTVVLVIFRKKLATRWRTVTITIFVIFVLGIAGVVALGVVKGRLPGKTMTVRWFYWTGSAKIVCQKPWLGVGPGNFPHAYMAVRRAEAEEQVKTPHNFLAHAFTQFGAVGGTVYVAILAVFLVTAARPGLVKRHGRLQCLQPHWKNSMRLDWGIFWTFAFTTAVAFLSRWIVFAGGSEADVSLVILECVLPAVLLAMMLAVSVWFASPSQLDDLPESAIRFMRIALAGGAGGFVLHNLVSYGLWAGGPATAFWVVVAAAAGAGPGRVVSVLSRWRGPIAVAGVLCLIVAAIFLASPVYRRANRTEKLAQALVARNLPLARSQALSATLADPLDATARINAARVISIASTSQAHSSDLQAGLLQAKEAMEIDPHNSGAARLAGQIAQRLAQQNPTTQAKSLAVAVEYFGRAVELDPANGRLRLEYARVLMQAGDNNRASQQIDAAEELNRKLVKFDPGSSSAFGTRQQLEIRELRSIK